MGAQSDKIRRELERATADVQDELANRMVGKLRERTPIRTGHTASRWTAERNGQAVDVTNDEAETIMRLNDGHSRQRPAGFVDAAIDETLVEMQREVDKP